MGRPIYEQLEDRERQARVAAELCEAWDLIDIFPLPPLAVCDFLMLRPDSSLALAELKCRSTRSLHYPTLHLSKHKLDRIVIVSCALKMPFFLIVQWVDGIFWQEITPTDLPMLKTAIGGRDDRGDAADREQVYEIPATSFQPLRKPA